MHAAAICIRHFQPEDAQAVSVLFREVYGACYVYPEVYLPSLICARNTSRTWQSAVATCAGRVVGHAALLLPADPAGVAEIAMLVAAPDVTGKGVGLRVSRYLCQWARQAGLGMLQAMLVCSHKQSQRMAHPLGFSTCGLLLDYLPSSFARGQRESYVVSCLPLRPSPLPDVDWPEGCAAWRDAMVARHGVRGPGHAAGDMPVPRTVEVRTDGELLALTIHQADAHLLEEACDLPAQRPRLVRLRVANNLAGATLRLQQAGFRHTGLMPAEDGTWYWLMQAGFAAQRVELHCDVARAMFESLQC